MKLSKLLFGSLVLAVPFAACTNEDLMETLPSTPESVLEQAVSLGEDFSIVGQKSGAQTKFVWDTELNGAWETTDTVGGAWLAYYVDEDNSGKLDKFFSNHPFAFVKEVADGAAEFKAPTNAMAGKYVLYYPYNFKVTTVDNEIPIEFDQNPVMDCTSGKEMDHINANFFAWCNTEFKVGGPQAGEFTLNQAGNLIVLNIGSNEANIDRIQNKEISKIILEGKTAGDAAALYNEATININGSSYANAVGKYTPGTAVSTYILTPENATADYQVTAAGETGVTKKPFYISMLPAKEDIATLTVRVILRDGRVYTKVFEKDDNADLFGKLMKSEQKIELEALLEEEETAGSIYTAEQFNDALNSGEATITLAADVELPSLSFNKRNKTVSILGDFTLTVAGAIDVTDGNLTINKLNAKGAVNVGEYGDLTVSKLEGAGAVTVDGTANITGSAATKEIASVEVTKAASLTLSTVKVKGAMTIGRSATVTLDKVTLGGKTDNLGGIVIVNSANAVTNNGTFTNEGTLDLNGAGGFENNATFNQNQMLTGTNGTFNNNPGATLNVNANTTAKIVNDAADATKGKEAAVIEITGTSASSKTTLTVDGTNSLTNSGVINVNAFGELSESAGLTQTGAAARIYVADAKTAGEGGAVSITSALSEGYIVAKGVNASIAATASADIIATEVTANTQVANINSSAKVYLMTGNFTNAQLTTLLASAVTKTAYFTGGTITLAGDYTLLGNVSFDGTVAVKAASSVSSGSTVTLTFTQSKTNTVVAGATLDVRDTKVKLAGSSATAILTIEANATLLRHENVKGSDINFTFE